MRLRSWDGPADATALQRLASRLWPGGPHPGGIGWEYASRQLPEKIMLAEAGGTDALGGLAGWAGLAGSELVVQVDPAAPEAARALAAWAVEAAAKLSITVYDGDEAVLAAVVEAGFVRQDGERTVGMFHPAGPTRVKLPAGYTVRSVRDGESEARVQAHRAAWRPVTLPWPGEVPATVTPETTSRFTAEDYERLSSTWLYEPTWDLVVQAPDGSLAASCVAWWDPATKCAEIEPLGVVPEHRRRGLATAMVMEVVRRVGAAGGEQVFINVGPRTDYPAPSQTYLAAGFTVVGRGDLYQLG